MAANDDISMRRAQQRRAAILRLTDLVVGLQWDPHWQFELRVTGRGWVVLMMTAAVAMFGVTCALVPLVIAGWIVAGDWRMLALCGTVSAIAVWRTVALVRQMVRRSLERGPERAA